MLFATSKIIGFMVDGLPRMAENYGVPSAFVYSIYLAGLAIIVAIVLFRNYIKKGGVET